MRDDLWAEVYAYIEETVASGVQDDIDSDFATKVYEMDLDLRDLVQKVWADIDVAVSKYKDYKDSEDEPHLIEFREEGWTIQHPLSCRPNLFACPVNRAAEEGLTEPPSEWVDTIPGVYECGVDRYGDFVVLGAVNE